MHVTRTRVVIAFTALYVIWGSTYLAIRFAIESLPLFLMAGARFLTAGVILYGWSRLQGGDPRPSGKEWRSATIIGGLLLCGGNGCVVWAEQFIPSAMAALFIAVTPLWMVLFEWAAGGVRPRLGVFAGILVGFFGVWLLMSPGLLSHGPSSLHAGGAGMLLLAAILWSIGSVYSKRAPLPSSPLLATGMEMIVGGVLLLLLGLVQGETIHLSAWTIKSLLAFLYLIVFGSLVGFTAYIWLLKAVGIAKASTYAFVNPLVAVILGGTLGGERITSQTMVAALIIVAAVVVITAYHKEEMRGRIE